MLRTLLIAATALMFATSAKAAEQTYVLDNPHTQIFFTVGHMGFSHSTGSFTGYNGSFTFDPANPTAGRAEVTIDTNSLNMGHDTWEEHVKGAKMFNVEKFPTMTFKSTKVESTGDKTAKMTGDLTLLGVTKPVTLDVTMNKCEPHPFTKKDACGFDAVGSLKRSDFGMSEGIPMVSDEVSLRITVEGQVAGDAASAGQNQ